MTRSGRPGWAALFAACVLLAVVRAGDPAAVEAATPAAIPDVRTITTDTLNSRLYQLATEHGEVILTTFALPSDEAQVATALDMLKNFYYHLGVVGALPHLLLAVQDERTYRVVQQSMRVTAFLDKCTPREAELAGADPYAPGSPNTVSEVARYWLTSRAVSLGYSVLMVDSDVVFLGWPFGPFRDVRDGENPPEWPIQSISPLRSLAGASFDVQLLSDWSTTEAPIPGDTLNATCPRFVQVADDLAPLGAMVIDLEVAAAPEDKVPISMHVPCGNPALVFFAATMPTADFTLNLAARLTAEKTRHQPHAAALNEMALAFVWGAGHQRPLRVRLLPHSEAAHMKAYEARKAAGLRSAPFALRSRDKAQYSAVGIWKPEQLTERFLDSNLYAPGASQRGLLITLFDLLLHALCGAGISIGVIFLLGRGRAGAFSRTRSGVASR